MVGPESAGLNFLEADSESKSSALLLECNQPPTFGIMACYAMPSAQ
jgi:hypothetical protein